MPDLTNNPDKLLNQRHLYNSEIIATHFSVVALMNHHSPPSYMPNGNFPLCLQPFAINGKSKCNIDRTHKHLAYGPYELSYCVDA